MNGAPRLRIEWEWEAAPAIKAPELRATFARLKIFVDGDCVTLVEDRQSASSRRSIACSLYPLAEWVAYNWWFLQADSRPASAVSLLRSQRDFPSGGGRQHWHRHCLRGAGDGFLWPNLFVFPEGSYTRLLWRPDRGLSNDRPIRYLTLGETVVASDEIQEVLANFVESVVERLVDCGVERNRLVDEWSGIQEADADEAAYCRAAARLGLDPYSEAVKHESEILRASNELGPDLLDEFLGAINPDKIGEDLDWISAARREIESISGQQGLGIGQVRNEVVTSLQAADSSVPWERGYAGARAMRRAIGLAATERFDFDGYVNKTILAAPDRSLHALGGGVDTGPSVVLGRQQLGDSERFTLARALWNLLSRPGAQFLITPAHTIRQKVERAFAAELLAPADGVAEIIGAGPEDIGVDELESAERHFGVSSLIIQHQIDNQLAVASR